MSLTFAVVFSQTIFYCLLCLTLELSRDDVLADSWFLVVWKPIRLLRSTTVYPLLGAETKKEHRVAMHQQT